MSFGDNPMSFRREAIAFLVFAAACVLIALQVMGTFGSVPKIILAVAVLAGIVALRWTRIRGAN